MTIEEILEQLHAADVVPYLDGETLRGSYPEGAYSDELRALVNTHRQGIIEYLKEQGRTRATALANTLAAIRKVRSLTTGKSGRGRVLDVYETLARRWGEEGDAKLFEIVETVEVMANRWRDVDEGRIVEGDYLWIS